MKLFEYKTEQVLPVEIEEAWNFFSDPKNLTRITPDFLDLKIIDPFEDKEIYSGMVINYTVKPLFGIPVKWRTEISMVEKPYKFVDRQIKGPYALWEHTHKFSKSENGVLVEDHVRYALPFGFAGAMLHPLLVQKKIEKIFVFRRQILEDIFK